MGVHCAPVERRSCNCWASLLERNNVLQLMRRVLVVNYMVNCLRKEEVSGGQYTPSRLVSTNTFIANHHKPTSKQHV
jgi:hypothetical protein